MGKSSPQFSRRWSTRLVAALGIVLAAAWGPLSHTLRLVEVSEVGTPGTEPSLRIVVARAGPFGNAKKCASKKSTSTPIQSSEKTTSERLLNAAPDNLETAQAVHFDLGGVPVPEWVTAWYGCAETVGITFGVRLPKSFDPDISPARGPPGA